MAIIKKTVGNNGEPVLSLFNPADNTHLYDIHCQSPAEVASVVAKAREAQFAWAEKSIQQRIDLMYRLRDVILEKQDKILDVVIRETGKSPQDALTFEVFAVAAFITYWCKQAPRTLRADRQRASGIMGFVKRIHTFYKPLGVVGVISPWNGPFVLTANPCIQAMLAGNTVIAKGSEITPYCAKILEELCLEAGFPEGVCQVLIGDGSTGAALTQCTLDKMAFTGSVATGKKVAHSCVDSLIPYSLELGGKDAMIVCNDANIDDAAHAAVWGSCVNTGHFCCSIERIYVEARIYDRFLEAVVKKVDALKQGQQFHYDEDLGAVFSGQQMAIIDAHVKQAVKQGAKVLTGGKPLQGTGLYYPATVITDVDESSDLLAEETFGPVMPIIKVETVEQAIIKANCSKYGLHGTVWTKDRKKGLEIAQRMETGSIAVNDIGIMYGVANASFGGVKESGVGTINGRLGLRDYTHAMPVAVGRYAGKESGYPHTEKKFKQMQGLMRLLWQSRLGRLLFGG